MTLVAPPPFRERLISPKGNVIIEEGSQSNGEAYLITSGKVEIRKRIGNTDVLVTTRGPNDLIGEMALIDDGLRSATAVALTRVTLDVIKKEELLMWLAKSPERTHDMFVGLLRRLRDTTRELAVRATMS